jgi:hypothetical protein
MLRALGRFQIVMAGAARVGQDPLDGRPGEIEGHRGRRSRCREWRHTDQTLISQPTSRVARCHDGRTRAFRRPRRRRSTMTYCAAGLKRSLARESLTGGPGASRAKHGRHPAVLIRNALLRG